MIIEKQNENTKISNGYWILFDDLVKLKGTLAIYDWV